MSLESKTVQVENGAVKFSIFSYGFRPFFLAAGIYAILPLLPWALYLGGLWDTHISLHNWHAHEMLFGFVAAAFSGFLLTAIPNWTKTPPLTGSGLKLFFSFWILGRIAFWLYLFVDHPILRLLLFVDLLLPLAQSYRTARIFIKTENYRHLIFSGILVCLGIANLMVILDLNDWTEGTAQIAAAFAPNIVMIMLAIIGGRVIPNFSRNYLQQKNISADVVTIKQLEILALGLLLVNVIGDLLLPHSFPSYLIAILAGGVHLMRFLGWKTLKVIDNPLLWVLHLGYAWLIVSLIIKGLEGFINLPYHLYLHILTLGSIGTFILGVMSRAALGHTGRALQVNQIMIVAFLLMSLATFLRTLAAFTTDFQTILMETTTIVWIVAFGIFIFVYLPILTNPRIDGKPG